MSVSTHLPAPPYFCGNQSLPAAQAARGSLQSLRSKCISCFARTILSNRRHKYLSQPIPALQEGMSQSHKAFSQFEAIFTDSYRNMDHMHLYSLLQSTYQNCTTLPCQFPACDMTGAVA